MAPPKFRGYGLAGNRMVCFFELLAEVLLQQQSLAQHGIRMYNAARPQQERVQSGWWTTRAWTTWKHRGRPAIHVATFMQQNHACSCAYLQHEPDGRTRVKCAAPVRTKKNLRAMCFFPETRSELQRTHSLLAKTVSSETETSRFVLARCWPSKLRRP